MATILVFNKLWESIMSDTDSTVMWKSNYSVIINGLAMILNLAMILSICVMLCLQCKVNFFIITYPIVNVMQSLAWLHFSFRNFQSKSEVDYYCEIDNYFMLVLFCSIGTIALTICYAYRHRILGMVSISGLWLMMFEKKFSAKSNKKPYICGELCKVNDDSFDDCRAKLLVDFMLLLGIPLWWWYSSLSGHLHHPKMLDFYFPRRLMLLMSLYYGMITSVIVFRDSILLLFDLNLIGDQNMADFQMIANIMVLIIIPIEFFGYYICKRHQNVSNQRGIVQVEIIEFNVNN